MISGRPSSRVRQHSNAWYSRTMSLGFRMSDHKAPIGGGVATVALSERHQRSVPSSRTSISAESGSQSTNMSSTAPVDDMTAALAPKQAIASFNAGSRAAVRYLRGSVESNN